MTSANLLDEPQSSVRDDWCQAVHAGARPWLKQLERDPQQLLAWLAAQRNTRRLGFYYAALLEFWVRFCPVLGGTAEGAAVLSQQQVHAGLGGAVAGQLKCVYQRRRDGAVRPFGSSTDGGDGGGSGGGGGGGGGADIELVHWESHVKYFVFVPPGEVAGEPAGGNDGAAAAADGLARYVGPFLGENMLHRVVELQRKLALSEAPGVQGFLAARFAATEAAVGGATTTSATAPDASTTSSAASPLPPPPPQSPPPPQPAATICREAVVRGWLFYPLRADGKRGNAAALELPCALATQLNASHQRGWWTRELQQALTLFPRSLWAVPGSSYDAVPQPAPQWSYDAALGATSQGGEGCRAKKGRAESKLHWLAPARAVRAASASSSYEIGGEEALGIAPCALHTADELARLLRGRRDGVDGPLLLLQFEQVAAEAEAGATEEGDEGAACWVERSRGFLMPPDWDPAPLCRAAPLGVRNHQRGHGNQCTAYEAARAAGASAAAATAASTAAREDDRDSVERLGAGSPARLSGSGAPDLGVYRPLVGVSPDRPVGGGEASQQEQQQQLQAGCDGSGGGSEEGCRSSASARSSGLSGGGDGSSGNGGNGGVAPTRSGVYNKAVLYRQSLPRDSAQSDALAVRVGKRGGFGASGASGASGCDRGRRGLLLSQARPRARGQVDGQRAGGAPPVDDRVQGQVRRSQGGPGRNLRGGNHRGQVGHHGQAHVDRHRRAAWPSAPAVQARCRPHERMQMSRTLRPEVVWRETDRYLTWHMARRPWHSQITDPLLRPSHLIFEGSKRGLWILLVCGFTSRTHTAAAQSSSRACALRIDDRL